MSDLLQKQWIAASAVAIFTYWVLVLFVPFGVSDPKIRSDVPVWFWCTLGAAVTYFSYTGFRAWRRGWKARFVLRIVVPAVLFLSASTFSGFQAWVR